MALVIWERSRKLCFSVRRWSGPDGPRVIVSVFNSKPLTNDEAVELAQAILDATDRGLGVCCAGCESLCDHRDDAEGES